MRPLNYVQYAETDFSFLSRLADDYGCWLRPTAEGIEIKDQFGDTVDLTLRDELASRSSPPGARWRQPFSMALTIITTR